MNTDAHGNWTFPAPLELAPVFEIRVRVGEAYELGELDGERRRMNPILGGELDGPAGSGVVLPGGADWQTLGPDGLARLHARYAIRMSTGDIIEVKNRGVRRPSAEVAARTASGPEVDPSLQYFVTTPVFEAPRGPHRWLREHVFLARGLRFPDRVHIQVFRVC
jgi:hypothetical protein